MLQKRQKLIFLDFLQKLLFIWVPKTIYNNWEKYIYFFSTKIATKFFRKK